MSDRKIPLLRWESLFRFLFLFLGGVRAMWTLQHCDTVAPSQTFPDDCCPINSEVTSCTVSVIRKESIWDGWLM